MEAPTQIPATPSRPPPPPPPPSATTVVATTSHRPEALATTKRKFHALLDSLTRSASKATASSSTPISGSTFDSPAKRIRLEAQKRLEASTASTTSTTSAYIQSQLLTSRLAAARRQASSNTTTANADTTSNEPNYLPSSHIAFLRRLKTFADLSVWTSKPDPINEVTWAKKGWICVGVNTVACKGGCEQRVVVALRPPRKDEEGKDISGSEDYSVDVDDELVRRYVELVNTGHEEDCLWRSAGCRDDIYRLQIARPTVWQPQLKERYRSFVVMADALPALETLDIPFNVSEVARQFPKDFFGLRDTNTVSIGTENTPRASPAPTSEIADPFINHNALAFALLGWHGSADTPLTSSPSSAIATCDHCFRRLGLWLYTSKSPNTDVAANMDTDTESSITASQQLDLHLNHRTYCPWISAESQCMPGSFAGLAVWEVLLRLISNTFPINTSSSNTATPEKRRQTISTSTLSAQNTIPSIQVETPTRPTTSHVPASRPSTNTSTTQNHNLHTNALATNSDPSAQLHSQPNLRTLPSIASIAHSTTAQYGGDENDEGERMKEVNEERERKKRVKMEREEGDKARFQKLKELGRAIGLGKGSVKRKA